MTHGDVKAGLTTFAQRFVRPIPTVSPLVTYFIHADTFACAALKHGGILAMRD